LTSSRQTAATSTKLSHHKRQQGQGEEEPWLEKRREGKKGEGKKERLTERKGERREEST
jgi:hypothetical protein